MRQVAASARPAFRAFSRLLVAAAGLTLGLIVLGATVHDLGAGLACPDPALCYGQLWPAFDAAILLQWLHRVLAVVLAVGVAGAGIWMLRVPVLRQPFAVQIGTALALVTTSGILGGLTVARHLETLAVAAHRLNAVLLLTVLVWAAARAVTIGREPGNVRPIRPVPPAVRGAFAVLTVLMLAELGLGGLAVGFGAALPCTGTGDCGLNKLWAGLSPAVLLPLLDRALVLALLAGSVLLSIAAGRLTLPRISRVAVRLSPTLLVAQVVIGMVNVHFGLPPWASVAQLSVAALQYALLLLGTVTLHETAAATARPPPDVAAQRRLAHEGPDYMSNRTQAQTFPAPEPLAAPTLSWRSYLPLTKPTITLLVVVTVVPTLLIAAHGMPKLTVALAALIGTYLASASASVFNHLLDADLDAVMNRTRGRPVPSGQVSTGSAFAFGAALGIGSLWVLGRFTTPLAAAVALSANIFYVLVYTLCLKRHTDQNIVIGGAAGAVGPLIGWAAVTGTLAWPAWVLFGVIFLWTPPHFWALAIKYKRDYAAAGIPMLPVSRGEAVTRRQIFAYTLTLIPPVIALYAGGAGGLTFVITSLAATLYFIWKAWQLLKAGEGANSMPVFHYSCLYLFIVFGSLTLDRLLAVLL